jgi:hypothetical protein
VPLFRVTPYFISTAFHKNYDVDADGQRFAMIGTSGPPQVVPGRPSKAGTDDAGLINKVRIRALAPEGTAGATQTKGVLLRRTGG